MPRQLTCAGIHPAAARPRWRFITAGFLPPTSPKQRQRKAEGANLSLMDRPLNARHAAALREFAAQVRATLGDHLVDLRLFGSVARGDDAPDSDIDVFVVVQPHEQRVALENQIIDIAFDVNLEHNVYISPHVVTPAILEHPVWRETPFLKAIAREAVPL